MKSLPFIVLSFLLLTASNAMAAMHKWDEGELAIIMGISVPIVALAGLFVFLTLRYYFESKVQRAAIEKGQPIPLRQPTDARKPALILIALGLGYGIAAYLAVPAEETALSASVWGIVPLLIGIGLFVFHYLKVKEDRSDGEKPEAAGGIEAANPLATHSASDPQDA